MRMKLMKRFDCLIKDNLKISSLSEIKDCQKYYFHWLTKFASAKRDSKNSTSKKNESIFLRVNENGIAIIGQTPKS